MIFGDYGNSFAEIMEFFGMKAQRPKGLTGVQGVLDESH